MELRHLRYFQAVAEELSFSRAARRLHIAQPPLSQQIRRLERGLGVTLFERDSRSVRLTAAGEALYAHAQTVLALSDTIPDRVAAATAGESGFLAIACVPAGFAGLVGSIVRSFSRRYPKVKLSVRELNTRAQYDGLETGELDLALVRSGIESPQLSTRTVHDERLYVALPEEHALEASEQVELRELAQERFIFFSRAIGKWHFDQLVAICQEAGFSPTIAHECDSIMAQLGLVAGGLGVAVVTELTTFLRVPGVMYRAVHDVDARVPLLAVWPDQHPNPARDNLLDVLHDWSPHRIPTN